MIITIHLDSDIPIYQQIQNQIVAGIAHGELNPGELLPSVRTLADQLGINLHTVNKAYSLLQDDGYVVIHRRAGVRIADPEGKGDAARTARARREIKQALIRAAQEAVIWQIDRSEFVDTAAQAFDTIGSTERGGQQ